MPLWLTGGEIAFRVLLAAWEGPAALRSSLFGALARGLVFRPFVSRGWLGAADALLLAAVGAWQGWRVALWATWGTAAAGALLALAVWAWGRRHARRGGTTRLAAAVAEPFPYVPAVLAGAVLALLTAV